MKLLNEDEELKMALIKLKLAEQNFNYATGDFIEKSIYELKAAEIHFNSILKARKIERCLQYEGNQLIN